jgi:hypothetical protein
MAPVPIAPAITVALVAVAGYGALNARRIGTGEVARVRNAAAGCHVTHPNGRTPPGESTSDSFYGKHGLWTVLPLDGMLRITAIRPVPPGETFGQISPDGTLSTKFPWWGSKSAAAKLTIRGTRVDGPARPLRLTVRPGATANSPHFWATRLRFARPGCWRVTATSGDAHLAFTLAVSRASD